MKQINGFNWIRLKSIGAALCLEYINEIEVPIEMWILSGRHVALNLQVGPT
jgi:hypothetical protein